MSFVEKTNFQPSERDERQPTLPSTATASGKPRQRVCFIILNTLFTRVLIRITEVSVR